MSLNYKEIELILSEAELENAKIQAVVQTSFHSVRFDLYDRERGRFSFYTELGTLQSRLHLISESTKLTKTKKLQRFEQYCRKNIEGSVIESVYQYPFDRLVVFSLNNHDRILKLYFRFYSGPGANIIVTDKDDVIQDLLFRRPGRSEVSSEKLIVETRTKSDKVFTVRPWTGNSFNEFIESSYSLIDQQDQYQNLYKRVQERMESELNRLSLSIKSSQKTIDSNKDYDEFRKTADLLSASSYLLKKGEDRITLNDWENDGKSITIALDKSLSPGGNVKAYYDKYQKAKGAFDNATNEYNRLTEDYNKTKSRFENALEDTGNQKVDIRRLKAILDKSAPEVQKDTAPGIRTTSGGFEIFAGRNAKENDELLRHYAKGNDMWLHTRDFPGGYVFIKFKRNKSIPLEVLLDAANIAVLYSKGRNSSSVDLYYTQVKHLRRAKDSKTGLVLPSQEKNLTIKPDSARIARLLPKERQ